MGRRFLILVLCLLFSMIPFAWGIGDDFDTLLSQGNKHLQQGEYFLALHELGLARDRATTPPQQTQAQGLLGVTHYQMHHFDHANGLLHTAIDSGIGNSSDRARWIATLASLQASRKQMGDARRLYAEAMKLAVDNPGVRTSIRLSQLPLLDPAQRLAELEQIRDSLKEITVPLDRACRLLDIGMTAQTLGTAGVPLAYYSFAQARSVLTDQEPRLLADALGGLAQLYEDQKRYEESLSLNQQAMTALRDLEEHDLLIGLEWRQARLYRYLQKPALALAAYQSAIEHIEAIRQDIPIEYHNGRSSFRDTLEPIYLGFADMLLSEASHASGATQTALLYRARTTVELIKKAEMEDFLGGRCAVHSNDNTLLEERDASVAILYPIILQNRLVLLLSNGKEMQQFVQTVPASVVEGAARRLAFRLRTNSSDIQFVSRQLYEWLIAPVESWLHQHTIKTLVIVPDGVLRLIPPAVLYDGTQYLVEKYALAISPGLSLGESKPNHTHSIQFLVAGMSEPGAVVEHLPPNMIRTLSHAAERDAAHNSDRPPSRALPTGDATTDTDPIRGTDREILRSPSVLKHIQDRLILPGVVKEMETLSAALPNTLLMNTTFTLSRFTQELEQNAYSVVHIASHGVFGGTAETTFIMASDNIIDINELERLLQSKKFLDQPVELLTLSACQTAEGDDRAPMGLSGLALKAKVRSTLGTLWPLSDRAAPIIMAAFYKGLLEPGVSKAQALRLAQLSLLAQKEFSAPFYWAPFILVGNWE